MDRIEVKDLGEAEGWINVLHRRTVSDAKYIYAINERLRKLENPGWHRFWLRAKWWLSPWQWHV